MKPKSLWEIRCGQLAASLRTVEACHARAEADRDRRKARAQALERAIKQLPHKAMNAACHICKHQARGNMLCCGNPDGGCKNGNYVGWELDEARFDEEEEDT